MLRALVLGLALVAAASGATVKTNVVVGGTTVGKFIHDDAVTGARPGLIFFSYDGKVNDFTERQAESMLGVAQGVRTMIVDVFAATGTSKTDATEFTNEEMASAVATAYDVMKTCELCTTAVDGTKIALIGYGIGGNMVMEGLARNVAFQAGVAYTPILNRVSTLNADTTYPQRMLIMPGYEDVSAIDALEKDNLEQTAGMLLFEIFIQYNTAIHFNVDVVSNYKASQANRAFTQTASFLNAAMAGAFTTSGSMMPGRGSYDEDTFMYSVGDNQEVQGMIVRDKTLGPRPAIIVVPAWGGFSEYEIERLHFYAKMGYVAMSANIYGLQIGTVLPMNERGAQVGIWREAGNDVKGRLFADRIAAAYAYLTQQDFVSNDLASALGFCFGGTGVYNTYRYGKPMQVHASFHGNMMKTRDFSGVTNPNFQGYLAMYVGTLDEGESGTTMVEHLAEISRFNGMWEMTRYSNTNHGFSEWGAARYNAYAEGRSFESFSALLEDKMPAVGGAASVAASLLLPLLAAFAALFISM